MSSNIYITPSTSLIVVRTLANPTTIYLSTFNVPDFQLNIRDATGSSALTTNPIRISTIGGAHFTDTTDFYAITQPFGFVNLSLRTSTLWQLLHTSGQVPSQSAATIETARFSTLNSDNTQIGFKYVSSYTAESLQTLTAIQLPGSLIVGSLSTAGSVQLQSSLTVIGPTLFQSSVLLRGPTVFQSSLSVHTLLPVSSVFYAESSVGVGSALYVGGTTTVFSTLHTASSIQVQTLAVQLSTPGIVGVHADSVRIAGLLSSFNTTAITSEFHISENLYVAGTLSSLGGLFTTSFATLGGRLHALSSLSTLSSATFASSLVLQQSLTLQQWISSISSATVSQYVSSSHAVADLVSSATSFSTTGTLSVLSTMTVKGIMSTQSLQVTKTLSVGTNCLTGQDLVPVDTAHFSTILVDAFARFATLQISSSIGIAGSITVKQSTITSQALLGGSTLTSSLVGTTTATFQSTVDIASDLRIRGDLTILGVTRINTYDVPSYGASTVFVTTSSPSIAFQASTLYVSSLTTLQSKFITLPQSGEIVITTPKDIQANGVLSRSLELYRLSTQTVTTNAVLPTTPSLTDPMFEMSLVSIFPQGLSSLFLRAEETIQGDLFQGSFVGDGSQLQNPTLGFSTLSATTVLVSTIETNLFSVARVSLQSNVTISSQLAVDRYVVFQSLVTIPAVIASTGTLNYEDETFLPALQLFGTSTFATIETLNVSTVAINRTLFLNAQSRRVGILTSTPQYNLDIQGSLYCTGSILASTVGSLALSTSQPRVYFSSIFYSSIALRDSITLPPGNSNSAGQSTFALTLTNPFLSTTTFEKALFLSERVLPYPIEYTGTSSRCGIFTNSNASTIDINFSLFVYNSTQTVGINTIDTNQTTLTAVPSYVPSYALTVNGSLQGTEIRCSTLSLFTTLTTSSLVLPTLGINPQVPSTLNTLSTPSLSTLIINRCAELIKDTTQRGSFHIQRPPTTPLYKALFCVYSDAHISSLSVTNLAAGAISYGFQDL